MEPGTFLVDADRGEERFRVQRLLHAGRSYQIALAEDVLMDDKLVCVKAIAYDAEHLDDTAYVAGRRKVLYAEMAFLAEPVHLLPEPLDWLQIDGSDTVLAREPLLVYEYTHGETLHELITRRHPEGLNPLRALRMIRELAKFLGELHTRKYAFRDLDPRHIVIGYDDVLHVVGCGNAAKMGEAPNATKLDLNAAYTAPEIRGERSGKLLRPAADLYGLGALLSFLLTGEEPRDVVENPLSKAAYEKLTNLDPPGLTLLVARLMQPLAKKRFGRAEQLLPFTTPEGLPSAKSEGFGLIQLPAPWSGAEAPQGRGARSRLSAGPLISVPAGQGKAGPADPAKAEQGGGLQQGPASGELDKAGPSTTAVVAILGVLLFLAALAAAALFAL